MNGGKQLNIVKKSFLDKRIDSSRESKKRALVFSSEVNEYIHNLCANAILRAMKNGTYIYQKESECLSEGVS